MPVHLRTVQADSTLDCMTTAQPTTDTTLDMDAAIYALGLLAELVSGSRDNVALDIDPAKDAAARAAVRPLLETWVMPALAAIVTNNPDLRTHVQENRHYDHMKAAGEWMQKALACPAGHAHSVRTAGGTCAACEQPINEATVIRHRAPSGNRDADYFQATCTCGWEAAGFHPNRTVEGRRLAERDAEQHRCTPRT